MSSLLYVDPKTLTPLSLADDGQGDLFHPHRNHHVFLWKGTLYYQITPDLYAYLRDERERARENVTRKILPLVEFEKIDERFLKIRNWAIDALGEPALRVAVAAFRPETFRLPTAVYRPAPGEVELPLPGEVGIAVDAGLADPESLPTQTPELIPVPTHLPRPLVLADPPSDSAPTPIPARLSTGPKPSTQAAPSSSSGTSSSLSPGDPHRLAEIAIKSPEVLARCHEIIGKSIDEVARTYFASEGFATPFEWARELSLKEDDPAQAEQAKAWLDTLRSREEELDEAARRADLAGTERFSILYLAAWRKVIYAYDDHVEAARRDERFHRIEEAI